VEAELQPQQLGERQADEDGGDEVKAPKIRRNAAEREGDFADR
jgi:hypothetical protein